MARRECFVVLGVVQQSMEVRCDGEESHHTVRLSGKVEWASGADWSACFPKDLRVDVTVESSDAPLDSIHLFDQVPKAIGYLLSPDSRGKRGQLGSTHSSIRVAPKPFAAIADHYLEWTEILLGIPSRLKDKSIVPVRSVILRVEPEENLE